MNNDEIIKLSGGKLGTKCTPPDITGLVGALQEEWQWDYYIEFNNDEKKWTLSISTGGWSDHEDIIEDLKGTFFWFMYWQESKRGGHYKFTGKVETNDE